jgi:hypothetical protein
MHDYDTGLDMAGFRVVADFPIDGVAVGEDLPARFRPKSAGVWELALGTPLTDLPGGKLTVSVTDRQGNTTRVERLLSVRKR